MELTPNELYHTVSEDYLSGLDADCPPPFFTVERELLSATNNAIEAWNLGPRDPSAPAGAPNNEAYPEQKPPSERLSKLKTLLPLQVALAIKYVHHAKLICLSDREEDGNYEIGVYQTEGRLAGCYDIRRDNLRALIRRYNVTITKRGIDEVVTILRTECPRVMRCQDADLVPVKNGVYDYGNKMLLGFDPDFVFTTKIDVDYVDGARNPVIHNDEDGTDWDVVSWMDSLSDDPETVRLLWQLLGAVIRPNVRWNKSAWLYSTRGNNGKGTFCTLARNLCGPEACASIKLKDFGHNFMLEPLTRVSAIITDENDTGTYLDDAAALKSIITGDPFLVDRKFKDAVSLKFNGFMIQCINELPKLRDKTDSMYRRLLVVPMNKSFEGRERKYIKSDYLNRRDVLEYVLYHVLAETDYYELDEPKACRELLADFKGYNDAVRQFLEDVLPEASWDLLPWQFLYDLYRRWMERFNPSGRPESKNAFVKDVKLLEAELGEWEVTPNTVRSANKMDWPETLILEYNVREWMNMAYRGSDPRTHRHARPEGALSRASPQPSPRRFELSDERRCGRERLGLCREVTKTGRAMRDRSLRSARGRRAERAGCLWVPALFVYGLSLWRGGEPPRRGLCRAYGARQDCGVRAATGDCRLCRPQRKLRQSPLCPFAFFAPKRTAEEPKAVSPDKCREAAAKKEAGIPCLVFAVRATCESASESPRLRAEGQRCFSLANALR